MMQRGSDRGRRATQAPRRSGLSRNVPEEKLNRPRFIDEDDGCACWASVFLLCTAAVCYDVFVKPPLTEMGSGRMEKWGRQ